MNIPIEAVSIPRQRIKVVDVESEITDDLEKYFSDPQAPGILICQPSRRRARLVHGRSIPLIRKKFGIRRGSERQCIIESLNEARDQIHVQPSTPAHQVARLCETSNSGIAIVWNPIVRLPNGLFLPNSVHSFLRADPMTVRRDNKALSEIIRGFNLREIDKLHAFYADHDLVIYYCSEGHHPPACPCVIHPSASCSIAEVARPGL